MSSRRRISQANLMCTRLIRDFNDLVGRSATALTQYLSARTLDNCMHRSGPICCLAEEGGIEPQSFRTHNVSSIGCTQYKSSSMIPRVTAFGL